MRAAGMFVLVTLTLVTFVRAGRLDAQTGLRAPGSMSGVALYNGTGVCPSGFWSPGPTNPPTCYTGTVTCANSATTPPLSIIFSNLVPPVVPPNPLAGSVVLFSGGGGALGDIKDTHLYAQTYYSDGYQVIQTAWSTDWEQTSDTLGILTAGCRPAAFLNYALTTTSPVILNPRLNSYPNAGFCAHGASAGAGALGYVLAQYNDASGNPLGSDLDDTELISGPVFGDIRMGCMVPGWPTLGSICPSGQYGCSNGTTNWTDAFPYVQQDAMDLQAWTNNPSCAGTTTTTNASNSAWLNMSIVNGTSGNFNYSNMGMSGWLCASYAPNDCQSSKGCPNNSAAEGNEFFLQITSVSQALGYTLTGVVQCQTAEDIGYGYDPDNGCTIPPNGGCPQTPGVCQCGYQAVSNHFQTYCTHANK